MSYEKGVIGRSKRLRDLEILSHLILSCDIRLKVFKVNANFFRRLWLLNWIKLKNQGYCITLQLARKWFYMCKQMLIVSF